MNYRQLGKSNLQVSSIGMGCVTFGREIDEPTSFTVLDQAVSAGINLLDTAEAYAAGASEEVVGRWMTSRKQRNNVVLATKVAGKLTKERIVSSAENSLKRLQTDHIDLFQLHHWYADAPIEEIVTALDSLVTQGKVRHIGCSNYSAEQLTQTLALQSSLELAPMISVQPGYNLIKRDIEAELLPLCEREQVGVLSFSPLGAGFLTGKYSKGGTIPSGTRFEVSPAHQDAYFSDKNFEVMENLRSKASASGHSMVQLALAWAISRQGITSVLIGARNREQVDQAFAAEILANSADIQPILTQL